MRICYISTYPPTECGIATYTQFLSDAMKSLEKEVVIVSQDGAKGDNVFPTFSPQDHNIAMKMFEVTSKLTPDVVHIEHEYGLFGSGRGVQIVDFLIRCRLYNLPVVMTLHTVYDKLDVYEKMMLENFILNCSAIIVHEKYQKQVLVEHFGSADKIHVIPHGIRECKRYPNAKKLLGIENKKVALLIGYFRPTKRFDRIVKIFPKVVERNKDALLLIAGKVRGVDFPEYQNDFFEEINNSPVRDNILVLRGQFPQHTFDIIMSAADLIAMPYTVGSQSGILAQSSAFYLPAVTSDLLSFEKWNEEIQGGLTAHNDDEYVDHICKILSDDDYAKQLENNIIENTKSYKWPELAKKHILVYESVIKVPYGKARYFYIPEDQEKPC